MFVHTVYFWLKPELTDAQRAAFREGLESLRRISSADALHVGAPAATNRPVVERSYDFGLTVVLKDLAAHDAYQADPLHRTFVDEFGPQWSRVLVYDAE